MDLNNASIQKAINQKDDNKLDSDFSVGYDENYEPDDYYDEQRQWDDGDYYRERDRENPDAYLRYEAEAEEERYNVSMIVSVDEALQQLANNNTASLRNFNELQPEKVFKDLIANRDETEQAKLLTIFSEILSDTTQA